jgi:hypothetical protein
MKKYLKNKVNLKKIGGQGRGMRDEGHVGPVLLIS